MSEFSEIYNKTLTTSNYGETAFGTAQNQQLVTFSQAYQQVQDSGSQLSDNSSSIQDPQDSLENQMENGFVVSPSRRKTYPALRSMLLYLLWLNSFNSSHSRN
jgi:hypothetical protein